MAACLLLFPQAALARDLPPQDHGGADLILEDGDVIWGLHSGVGRFEIPEGLTVRVKPFDGTGSWSRVNNRTGGVELRAQEIEIAGMLDARGSGFTGGGGGGGQGPNTGEGGIGGVGRYPVTAVPGANGIDGRSTKGLDGAETSFNDGGFGSIGGFPDGPYPGGYMQDGRNGDPTTGLETLMGSGGRGGMGGSNETGFPPRGGQTGLGGGGGASGGGEIRLFANERILILGTVDASGAPGQNGNGQDGGNAEPFEEGRGAQPPSAGFNAGGSGEPAGGGGILFHAPLVQLAGDAAVRNLRTTGTKKTGGTLKVFAETFEINPIFRVGEYEIEVGRLYVSSQPGLETGWRVY